MPNSSEIASIVQGQPLPALVNLQEARINAIEMWKKSNLTKEPLRRDGQPITEGEIRWIPPLDSMEVYSPSDKAFSLGKAGDLAEALRKAADELDDEIKDDKA